MIPRRLIVALALFSAACGGSVTTQTDASINTGTTIPEAGTFVKRSISLSGTTYLYQVFIPKAYNTGQKWPVIFYIDGSGGRGTDGVSMTVQSLGAIVRSRASTYPAIVVFPQIPAGETFSRATMMAICNAELDASVQAYNGDPARIYVTGISFGGSVAYQLAYENPTKFAALIPIASAYSDAAITSNPNAAQGSSYSLVAQRLKAMPVAIYEGQFDPNVASARGVAAALQAIGGNIRYTEMAGLGHDAIVWDSTYASADFYTWLYAQHR